MARRSAATKLTITIDPEVHRDVLAAALRDGVSVETWMADAARRALRLRAGLAAVAMWEKEHGPFTEEEMEEAHRRVRALLRRPRTVRRPA